MVRTGMAPAWPTWANGKEEWQALHNFMQSKKTEKPYPTYLYRYVIPRYDSPSRPVADFGSNLYESFPVPMPVGQAHTDGTVGSFFHELSKQLAKYQNQLQLRPTNKPCTEANEDGSEKKVGQTVRPGKDGSDGQGASDRPKLSPIVSLSGDFRWTVQKACKIMRASSGTVVPGVAVFDTALTKDVDCVLYRVSDLLAFFDARYPVSGPQPAAFADNVRYWANNAQEYVIWSHIPRSALVSYVSCAKLAPRGDRNFLTENFRRAKDLAVVRRGRWVRTNAKKYWNLAADLVSLFVLGMRHELLVKDPGRLHVEALLDTLVCPRQWGFLVLPISAKLPQNYKPKVDRILDFVETANLSHVWKTQMAQVAELVQLSVTVAVGKMRATAQEKHNKKCIKCKYQP